MSTTHVVPSNSSRRKGSRGGDREENGNGERGSEGKRRGRRRIERERGGEEGQLKGHVGLQGRCVSKVM